VVILEHTDVVVPAQSSLSARNSSQARVPHAACHAAGQICADIVSTRRVPSAHLTQPTYLLSALPRVPPATAGHSGIGSHAPSRQGAHQGQFGFGVDFELVGVAWVVDVVAEGRDKDAEHLFVKNGSLMTAGTMAAEIR
jgi:hypothetical protein